MHTHTTKNTQQKERVALSSIVASAGMTGMKLVVGLLTGSLGILSEAAHSLLDMGATIITYFAVRVSEKPADKRHPYGHGKIESISALAETILLFVTSIWIIYEAVQRLMHEGSAVIVTWYAFAIVFISIAIDYSRSRALLRVAKETKSQALEADALHFQSDIWSSCVVLFGLVCVSFGYQGADALAALGVAFFVLKVGYDMGKRTFDVLIDTAPEGVESVVKETLSAIPDIIAVERVRARTLGSTISIETTVTINRKHRGETVHGIIECAECALQKHFPDADILVHTKPVANPSETIAETIFMLAEKERHFVHNVLVDSLQGKLFVSYDLEVPAESTVAEAHTTASAFEEKMRRAIGVEAEINTHLDPARPTILQSATLDADMLHAVEQEIRTLAKEVPALHNMHNIRARRIARKFIVTAHCSVPKHMPLEEAHHYAEQLEYRILQSNPKIARALVHVEPE